MNQPINMNADAAIPSEQVGLLAQRACPPHGLVFKANELGELIDVSLDRTFCLTFFPNLGCECPACIQFWKMNFASSSYRSNLLMRQIVDSGFGNLKPYVEATTWNYVKENNANLGTLTVNLVDNKLGLYSAAYKKGDVLSRAVINFNDNFMLHCVYIALLAGDRAVNNYLKHFVPLPEFHDRLHLARVRKTFEFFMRYCVREIPLLVVNLPLGNACPAYEMLFDYKCSRFPFYGESKEQLRLKYGTIEENFHLKLSNGGFDFNKVNVESLEL